MCVGAWGVKGEIHPLNFCMESSSVLIIEISVSIDASRLYCKSLCQAIGTIFSNTVLHLHFP